MPGAPELLDPAIHVPEIFPDVDPKYLAGLLRWDALVYRQRCGCGCKAIERTECVIRDLSEKGEYPKSLNNEERSNIAPKNSWINISAQDNTPVNGTDRLSAPTSPSNALHPPIYTPAKVSAALTEMKVARPLQPESPNTQKKEEREGGGSVDAGGSFDRTEKGEGRTGDEERIWVNGELITSLGQAVDPKTQVQKRPVDVESQVRTMREEDEYAWEKSLMVLELVKSQQRDRRGLIELFAHRKEGCLLGLE
ncbi:hypothetical protein BDZ94DRAFT_1371008 [Collybia nuda]|uniref:Uncharacterized protein n=1 Tax=Collybia nuda TaxID=64659 RepID=A0A9P5Y3M5_9AGAR|nr:hypothetical protein BDZ94DRAFT_1371008 [Collybia nuda]